MPPEPNRPGVDPLAVHAFLKTSGIPVATVAAPLGTNKNILTNKLDPRYRNKLNPQDEDDLKLFFRRLHSALGDFLKSDLSEVPASLQALEIEPS